MSSAAPAPACDRAIRLGSLRLRLRTDHPQDAAIVATMFKLPEDDGPGEAGAGSDGDIEVLERARAERRPIPRDGLVVERSPASLTVASELMTMTAGRDGGRWQVRVLVHERGVEPHVHQTHLWIMLHRALLAFDAVHLHAAAVTLAGRTFVFVGEKGAGKSTIAASLGRRGGVILSDDHVLVRRAAPAYLVSGCETWARVTAETEAALFDAPLPIPARDFGGSMKKEFPVARFFPSRPHQDAPVAALLFPRVGSTLRLAGRSARAAALDLIGRTRKSYRPQDADDIGALLDFWSDLAASAPAFDLELSPDIGRLADLPDLLQGCGTPS